MRTILPPRAVCRCLATWWALTLVVAPQPARAGGGPENAFLVVNRRSPASLTIANHYVGLRAIPNDNVLLLPWDPAQQSVDVQTFREKLLEPVLKEIERRRLAPQIDYIVYSSDFPTAIGLEDDVKKFVADAKAEAKTRGMEEEKIGWPQVLTRVGSITGLTYLWQPVMARNPAYFDPQANSYFRGVGPNDKDRPTRAFGSGLAFDPHGEVVTGRGHHYMLSIMLGVTAGRGNTVEEVLDYLKRSAAADGTQPKGTIYFAENGDIRSKVRQQLFPATVEALKALGVGAEIVEGVLPIGRDDVQGLMVGAADFDWKASKSTIRPGAICEHFTSYGGEMQAGAGQTPISAWLRAGAAGTSGTVTEPYAVLTKFPVPAMHVHYARGCSLAEAFYQSVSQPYQLLILGDPLCRPWAKIPQVDVAGAAADATVKGTLSLKPTAKVPGGGAIDHFELFVDGLRHAVCKPGEQFSFDTATLGDGYHELRIVACDASPIRTQGRKLLPLIFANHGHTIDAWLNAKTVGDGEPLVLSAKSHGATALVVTYRGHLVGRINTDSGQTIVNRDSLGRGPVVLRVVGLGARPRDYTWAKPLAVTIE